MDAGSMGANELQLLPSKHDAMGSAEVVPHCARAGTKEGRREGME